MANRSLAARQRQASTTKERISIFCCGDEIGLFIFIKSAHPCVQNMLIMPRLFSAVDGDHFQKESEKIHENIFLLKFYVNSNDKINLRAFLQFS